MNLYIFYVTDYSGYTDMLYTKAMSRLEALLAFYFHEKDDLFFELTDVSTDNNYELEEQMMEFASENNFHFAFFEMDELTKIK